jgi:predicted TPR repeat methyltransferase
MALKTQPHNATAEHMVTALEGQKSIQTANPAYVAALFDQYAPYYSTHMRTQLKYQAPFLLRNAIARVLSTHTNAQRILDLGCGTGLCGIYFRDLASDLHGLDLSEAMLAEARQLDAYDKLIQADLRAFLQLKAIPFDIILAADVLGYLGELDSLFSKLQAFLTPQGVFAFTIETASEAASYGLQPTGRFTHNSAYIHTLCHVHGFSIALEEEAILREQQADKVLGKVFVLTQSH